MNEERTPEEREYEALVEIYYSDKITDVPLRVWQRMWELEQIVFTDQDRQTLVPDEVRPRIIEITLDRTELRVLGWDKGFLRRFEAWMEEDPRRGSMEPGGFYREFITAHRTLIAGVTKVLGDQGHKPFTVNIKVGPGRKPKPPGTWSLYSKGSVDY